MLRVTTSLKKPVSLALWEGIREAYGQDLYSDLEIQCGAETFRAHKIVVCPQSAFFEKAVRYGCGDKSTIILDDDRHVVETILRCLYQAGYGMDDWAAKTAAERAMLLTHHVWVYIVARKYFVAGVPELALDKFQQMAESCRDDALADCADLVYDYLVDEQRVDCMHAAVMQAIICRLKASSERGGELWERLSENSELAVDVAWCLSRS